MASAQNLCGSLVSISIERFDSTRVWFSLSATLFCSGVLGMVCTFVTYPFWLQVGFKLFDVYSPLLSEWRVFKFFPRLFHSKYLILCLERVDWVLSSVNVKKYSAPIDFSFIFPHMPEWTWSCLSQNDCDDASLQCTLCKNRCHSLHRNQIAPLAPFGPAS